MNSQDGYRQWIASLLDRHGGEMVRYAQRLVHDPQRAEDVVQETFLRLCQQPPDSLNGRLVPWLFSVCRNVALDLRRKEQKMTQLVDESVATLPSPQSLPVDQLELTEQTGQVIHLLTLLPENQQEVIRLKFQQGLSYKEISAVTGLSVGNVGFLIHVGLKRLRELSQTRN